MKKEEITNLVKEAIQAELNSRTAQVNKLNERAFNTSRYLSALQLRVAVTTELRFMYQTNEEKLGKILLGCAYAFDLPDKWWNQRDKFTMDSWAETMLKLPEIMQEKYESQSKKRQDKLITYTTGD